MVYIPSNVQGLELITFIIYIWFILCDKGFVVVMLFYGPSPHAISGAVSLHNLTDRGQGYL